MDYRALSQMELATEAFPAVQYDFRIFIDEAAFDRICNNADKTREVGGILVGDVLHVWNRFFDRRIQRLNLPVDGHRAGAVGDPYEVQRASR